MKNKGKFRVVEFNGLGEYAYNFCNRCGVWIQAEHWKDNGHPDCDKFLKGKAIRERAQKLALHGRKEQDKK